MIFDSTHVPFCVRFRTQKVLSSKIRYFDVLILVPNVLFLLFLLLKWLRTRSKLNINKPLLLSVTCLLLSITFSNIIRCLFVMIFPEYTFQTQETIVKILWLWICFMLLWTELSVLLFGTCFGRSQSIKTSRVLFLSCLLTSIYISLQAVFEFRRDTRPIQFQTDLYHLYSYGGMKFVLISSSILLTMYISLFCLPCLYQQHHKCLPIRRSFYFYCFVLALINLIQVIGTVLNLTETTISSMCIVEGTRCVFYTCFAPFVYHQFLRRALSSKVLIPQIIYSDSAIGGDEDDPLLNPAVNSSSERLDGQFDDITASTRILEPIL